MRHACPLQLCRQVRLVLTTEENFAKFCRLHTGPDDDHTCSVPPAGILGQKAPAERQLEGKHGEGWGEGKMTGTSPISPARREHLAMP